jgi:fructokinase
MRYSIGRRMKSSFKIVGLGEVLWDLLPAGRQLGGAPANFAYMTSLQGDEGVVASRVGDDALGRDALEALARLGLKPAFLQKDVDHPTGTAQVTVDPQGQPAFVITHPVAWDFLQWTPAWQALAGSADAVCFGTLAQRSPVARATIRRFLASVSSRTLRVFDVNLRQSFYSRDVLAESFAQSDIVKLNHEELPIVAGLLGLDFKSEPAAARLLQQKFSLRLVCVTRGAQGSLLVSPHASASHPGLPVKVADTVGAGDAFTACLVHHCLRGAPLEHINEEANRLAAWVATQVGGTPGLQGKAIREVLTPSAKN